jgi:hypothetical protein
MGTLLPQPGMVAEIVNGPLYDVAAWQPPEVIGVAVPAWVARVITCCTEGYVLAQVHNPYRPLGALLTTPVQARPADPSERPNPGPPLRRNRPREAVTNDGTR